MPNRYELTVTYICPLCRAEGTIKATIESHSSDIDALASKADDLPRYCTPCKRRGTVELGDRIRVMPLD